MKNKLTDLNNHLFEQLERLNDESIKGDALQQEIERAKAISGISKDIVGSAKLALDARKAIWEWNKTSDDIPKMLEAK